MAKVFGSAYGGALVDPNGHVQTIAGIEANMFLFSFVTMLLIATLGFAAWIWRYKS